MNGSEGAQGVCPDGWHIPTSAELTTLITFVGSNPGTKLKSKEPSTWNGNDTVGFKARPVGFCSYEGYPYGIDMGGTWWTSSFSIFTINYTSSDVYIENSNEYYDGYSVRCIFGP